MFSRSVGWPDDIVYARHQCLTTTPTMGECRRCGGKMVVDDRFVFVDVRPGADHKPKMSMQCETCGCVDPFGNV